MTPQCRCCNAHPATVAIRLGGAGTLVICDDCLAALVEALKQAEGAK